MAIMITIKPSSKTWCHGHRVTDMVLHIAQ